MAMIEGVERDYPYFVPFDFRVFFAACFTLARDVVGVRKRGSTTREESRSITLGLGTLIRWRLTVGHDQDIIRWKKGRWDSGSVFVVVCVERRPSAYSYCCGLLHDRTTLFSSC